MKGESKAGARAVLYSSTEDVPMDAPERVSFGQRVRMGFESFFLTRLIPRDSIPPFLRWLFRLPLFFERTGLNLFIPDNVLVLTTTGRRSGRPHKTPVEFAPGPRPGSLLVIAGWEGKTDWYRNARKQPCVQVARGGKEWEAMAEPVPDAEVAQVLKEQARLSSASNRVWSHWSGVEMDGSEASYLAAAPHFPCLYLNPIDPAERATRVEQARTAAIELLDCTRRDTRTLLRKLDPEMVVQQRQQGWRVRDVLGHLGAWAAEAARSLEAHADGGEYICIGSSDEYDAYNARAAAERSKWAIEEVWTEYEEAHDELRIAVQGLPVEKWDRQMVYPWNERGTVEAFVKCMMKHEAADHCEGLVGRPA